MLIKQNESTTGAIVILGGKFVLGGLLKLSAVAMFGYVRSTSVDFGSYGDGDFIWNQK
jgi:hypothetical protein